MQQKTKIYCGWVLRSDASCHSCYYHIHNKYLDASFFYMSMLLHIDDWNSIDQSEARTGTIFKNKQTKNKQTTNYVQPLESKHVLLVE